MSRTIDIHFHPYDRFARRFDHASGKDAMYFDIHDKLLQSQEQPVQISVDYLDRGTGLFSLQYDAVGNNQKTAFGNKKQHKYMEDSLGCSQIGF
ncbi:hypothetical protein [Candidatus Villigracilis saccharophilus]|uniref:hypothetical protein n=1 Tax=Candidatus Villigracilis saccharophilus TaxID=3140684 RepID=UPI0031374F31|nr:hypothetical protein [Anaerolineales bacterium]